MNKSQYNQMSERNKSFNRYIIFLIIFFKSTIMETSQYCKFISFSNDNYYIISLNEISFFINLKEQLIFCRHL